MPCALPDVGKNAGIPTSRTTQLPPRGGHPSLGFAIRYAGHVRIDCGGVCVQECLRRMLHVPHSHRRGRVPKELL